MSSRSESDSESNRSGSPITHGPAPTPGHGLDRSASNSPQYTNRSQEASSERASSRGSRSRSGSPASSARSRSPSAESNKSGGSQRSADSNRSRKSRSRSVASNQSRRSHSGESNRSGSAGSNKSRGSGSNRSRSNTPAGSQRSRSSSAGSKKSRSRSRSAGSKKSRSRSRSGESNKSRSRSGSAASNRSRTSNRSRASNRSRSGSRSRSRSAASNRSNRSKSAESNRSKSPESNRSGSRSRSPSPEKAARSRSRSNSPNLQIDEPGSPDSGKGDKRKRDSSEEKTVKKKNRVIDSDSEGEEGKEDGKEVSAAAIFGDDADDISSEEEKEKIESDKEDARKSEEEEEQRRQTEDENEERQERGEEDEDKENEPEPIPETRIDVEIPKISCDLGRDIHFVKLPNFLSVETRPFDPETYEDEIDEEETLDEEGRARLKLKVENTIRWRETMDKEGNMKKESNARLVRWSDGSYSLHLGSEIFDVYKQPLQGDHNHLFIRQGTGLQGQAVFRTKLSFRPHSTESFTHRKMTLSLADRSQKTSGIKILSQVGADPDHDRKQLLKKEEEKLRQTVRVNKPRRKGDGGVRSHSSNVYREEDGSDEEGAISLNAIKNKYKSGAAASAKGIYSSDEEGSDIEARRARKLDKAKVLKDSDTSEDSHNVEQAVARPARSGPPPFSVGDKVKVIVSEEQLKTMQQGHGGWNPKMAEYIGKVGRVHRVTDKGDIRVQYEGCQNRWTFNPVTLSKVNSIAVGDIVCLRTDIEKVKELQKGHGEWIEIMKNSLGKLGKILKIYSDGDLRVQLDGHAWTLNPQCVRLVPGSAAELANTMQATQNQRQEPSMEWHPVNPADNQTNGVADQLVRAAAQGHLETVQRLLEGVSRGMVDMRSGGKTALQVAAHQGHAAIVKLLLHAGASVNASDNDGDTCLHYAAFGNQPEVLDLLIKAGSELNTANRSGCTALHIAAHKQPARCVQILLAAGADPNCTDLYGDTALHDAIGKDSYQVIELLCAASGIDFTLRNKRGFNALHHAALKGKNFATRKLLTQARQLVDVKKDDGFSALHLAALNGHKEVVETLVHLGQADINLRNNRNQTALLLAVSQGHCGVIELLIKLKANINAKDEDEDTALHLVLIKKAHLNGEIRQEDSPDIFTIYESISQVSEFRLAIAIACYLIQMGIDLDALNSKGQSALSLLQESNLQELLKSYKPNLDSNQIHQNTQETLSLESLSVNEARHSMDGYNLTDNTPKHSPARNLGNDDSKGTRRSRREQKSDKIFDIGGTSQENSPNHKNHYYQNEIVTTSKPVECLVCSELSEENVRLEPCNHKPACEDCSSRMKKCLQCGSIVQKRVTKDGRVIPAKSRQPSAERMRYLECKIAEIEESHACSICMERKRNVVFLCGHGTCSKCADTLKTCHMCRKTITKKIPIY